MLADNILKLHTNSLQGAKKAVRMGRAGTCLAGPGIIDKPFPSIHSTLEVGNMKC